MPTKKISTTNKKPVDSEASAELDNLILDLRKMRDKQKVLTTDIAELQQTILDQMDRQGIKSRRFKVGDKYVTASRRQNTSLVYDEKKLKKRLGAALWNKVTTRALDKKKLEAFVASGEVKPSWLAEASEEKQTKPFINIT